MLTLQNSCQPIIIQLHPCAYVRVLAERARCAESGHAQIQAVVLQKGLWPVTYVPLRMSQLHPPGLTLDITGNQYHKCSPLVMDAHQHHQ